MKKICSMLLAAAIAASFAMPVWAADTSEMKEVLSKVKERIPDTANYSEFDSSINEYDGVRKYDFSWYNSDEQGYSSINVSALPSGIITNYGCYNYNEYERIQKKPDINKMPVNEALEKAKQLFKKINPDIYSLYVIESSSQRESLFDDTYSFDMRRYENGVPVYNDTGYITVNSDATAIEYMYVDFTDGIDFKDSKDFIDEEKAWEYFGENVGMKLGYISDYDENDNAYAKLIYIPNIEYNQYINAETGELSATWHRQYYEEESNEEFSAAEKSADVDMGGYSEPEIEEIEGIDGLITKEEAEKVIRNSKILDFDSRETLKYIFLDNMRSADDYAYYMAFVLSKEDVYKCSSACVNARTGEIIAWDSYPDNENTITSGRYNERYLDKAIEGINPTHIDEYRIKTSDENRREYARYKNDIPFDDDYIDLEINPVNGKISSYYYRYSDIEFQPAENIISTSDAFDILKGKYELKLQYVPAVSKGKEKTAQKAEYYQKGYFLENWWCAIDAATGEFEYEYDYTEKELSYSDISGHYGETAIKTLAKYGIGFEEDQFKPNDIITQAEYIALLTSTFVYNSPIILNSVSEDTYEYQTAKRSGIIKSEEENPSEPLTREMAAVFMVRAMGFEEIANLEGIYKSPFADVKNNVGYIAILKGMKVFNGDDKNKFNPDKMLTRADAAIVIYNYLKNN